jgi:hypothetical protein
MKGSNIVMLATGLWRGIVLAVTAAGVVVAQTRIDLRTQGRNVDFADAVATRPFAVGTTLPESCTPGQAFFKSDAESGRNLYLCMADGVWRVTTGDPSVVTVAGLPDAASHAGRMFIVSDAVNKGDCSVGGGSVYTVCVSDGVSWSPVGGGTMDHSQLQNLDYASSGHTGFAPANHGSEHQHGGSDEIATEAAQPYGIPKAGSLGVLNRTWLPLMQGDTGEGGLSGAVPAPGPGDAGKCLKGDATWGSCGTAGGYTIIQDEGAALPQWPVLNLSGAGVTCSDDAANNRTTCAIPGGQAPYVQRFDTPLAVWTVDGATHGLGTEIEVFVQVEEGSSWRRADPAEVLIHGVTGDVTVQWATPTSGRILISALEGTVVTGGGSDFDAAATYDLSGLNKVNIAYVSIYLPNNTTTGTSLYRTVCLASNGTVEQCGVSNAGRTIGICMEGCGQTGNARIAIQGFLTCDFESGVTAGNWVTVSSSQAGKCADAGTSKPPVALGIALVTQTGAGSYDLIRGIQ